jgi:lipopolysaccharide export system permease protein
MLINKYIYKEIFKTLIIIAAILLFIAISNRLVVLLARSINSQFPLAAILQAVVLIIPELLSNVLPIALFGALIFSQSRMYADNEMVILFSSGFTNKNLIKLNTSIALILTVLALSCTLYFNPFLNHLRNKIALEQYNSSLHRLVVPGKFQSLLGGKIIFYAQSIYDNGMINNIFMTIKSKQEHMPDSIVTAQSGMIKNGILTLTKGHKYDGIPGQADYTIISFDEYTKPLVLNSERLFEHPDKLTNELLTSDNLKDRTELQFRLAMPFVSLILSILAIPLSRVKPRSGRFSNTVPAIVTFLLYYISLITTSKLMMQGKLPIYSLWIIHGLFMAYAFYKTSQKSL